MEPFFVIFLTLFSDTTYFTSVINDGPLINDGSLTYFTLFSAPTPFLGAPTPFLGAPTPFLGAPTPFLGTHFAFYEKVNYENENGLRQIAWSSPLKTII
jgi:hypothetical protein